MCNTPGDIGENPRKGHQMESLACIPKVHLISSHKVINSFTLFEAFHKEVENEINQTASFNPNFRFSFHHCKDQKIGPLWRIHEGELIKASMDEPRSKTKAHLLLKYFL